MRIRRSYPRFSPSPFLLARLFACSHFLYKNKKPSFFAQFTRGNVWLSGYTKAKLKLSLLFLLQ